MNTVYLAGDGVEVAKTAVDAVITAMSDVFYPVRQHHHPDYWSVYPDVLSGGKSGACRHRHFPFPDERGSRLIGSLAGAGFTRSRIFLFLPSEVLYMGYMFSFWFDIVESALSFLYNEDSDND